MHNVAITCMAMFHLQNYETKTFILMHAGGWRHHRQTSHDAAGQTRKNTYMYFQDKWQKLDNINSGFSRLL